MTSLVDYYMLHLSTLTNSDTQQASATTYQLQSGQDFIMHTGWFQLKVMDCICTSPSITVGCGQVCSVVVVTTPCCDVALHNSTL